MIKVQIALTNGEYVSKTYKTDVEAAEFITMLRGTPSSSIMTVKDANDSLGVTKFINVQYIVSVTVFPID